MAGGSSFGLCPPTQGCLGVVVSYATVDSFFPKGEVNFNIPFFHFRYFAPSASYIQSHPKHKISNNTRFCLGQDVWFGE